MSELTERLRAGAMARYRRDLATELLVGRITCQHALDSRQRWQDSTCAQVWGGHRCHRRGTHPTRGHECTCGTMWSRSEPEPAPPIQPTGRCEQIERDRGILPREGSSYCREVHADGHQCTWIRARHERGAASYEARHRCRGCRFEWDA